LSLVTVILPNYNHSQYLDQRLNSILNQTFKDFRLIILDDCSTDNSRNIIEKYRSHPNVSLIIYNVANAGSTFLQWEKGFQYCEGELLWIAESDDFCKLDFLEKSITAFADPNVVLSYTRSIDVNDRNEIIGFSYRQYYWCNFDFKKQGVEEINEHLYLQCTIPNVSAVLFRRSAINSSYFHHKYRLCGDWYFYIQILQKGKLVYYSEPLNYHRFHIASVRNKELSNIGLILERLDILSRIRKDFNLTFFKFILSINFQIKLFIFQTKFKNIITKKFLTTVFKILKKNILYFIFFLNAFLLRFIKTLAIKK